jgi:hypothetical protein
MKDPGTADATVCEQALYTEIVYHFAVDSRREEFAQPSIEDWVGVIYVFQVDRLGVHNVLEGIKSQDNVRVPADQRLSAAMRASPPTSVWSHRW